MYSKQYTTTPIVSCQDFATSSINASFGAKTDIAKLAIQKNCKKEYTGLEIDSEVADALFFSKACRCAIKSGKLSEISKVKKTLRLCEL